MLFEAQRKELITFLWTIRSRHAATQRGFLGEIFKIFLVIWIKMTESSNKPCVVFSPRKGKIV